MEKHKVFSKPVEQDPLLCEVFYRYDTQSLVRIMILYFRFARLDLFSNIELWRSGEIVEKTLFKNFDILMSPVFPIFHIVLTVNS